MMAQIITHKTKLVFNSEQDKQSVIDLLICARDVFNFCSEKHFGSNKNSIVELHAKCYKEARKIFNNTKAHMVVQVENQCLASYRSVKSNKHKIDKPIVKKKLSLSYNKNMISYKNDIISLLSTGERIKCKLQLYPLLEQYLSKYRFGDVTISSNNNEVYISLYFHVEIENNHQSKLAMGVDLGVRRLAATSEGNIFIDKQYNKQKRQLRYLKRQLRSKADLGSKTARKHLTKLSTKERNRNKNFNHHLANAILNTKADTIVLEDLQVNKLKAKKHKYQNKNKISQVSFSELKFYLTYKAHLKGKKVITVNPMYTSQDDCITGKRDGMRKGCRYYAKNGLIYDADINAAINIVRKSKLPFSQANLLDGQAVVSKPYDCKIKSFAL